MHEWMNESLLTLVYQGPNFDVLYFCVHEIVLLKPGSRRNKLVRAGIVKNIPLCSSHTALY